MPTLFTVNHPWNGTDNDQVHAYNKKNTHKQEPCVRDAVRKGPILKVGGCSAHPGFACPRNFFIFFIIFLWHTVQECECGGRFFDFITSFVRLRLFGAPPGRVQEESPIGGAATQPASHGRVQLCVLGEV